ncbi:MAG: hypothetical protein GEU83_14915 [Pseudonocardiaceae bacterium]|nr:hypothetical protein [Pseudonocardiaceae bacterium]
MLALVLGAGWVVGAQVGPLSAKAPASPVEHDAMVGETGAGQEREAAASPVGSPGGLAASAAGYTLETGTTSFAADAPQEFRFRITGPDGQPVRRFDVEHDNRMHLIVVRRDTASFQHVHPVMDTGGTWRVPLTLADAGSYRAFADFVPAGEKGQTLGTDLAVAGQFTPAEHRYSRTAAVDGYEVELAGQLVAGSSSRLTLSVSKDGRPVTDLQPYLAAYGHLVALREGDLAYLHVHPDGAPGDGRTRPGPQIVFYAEVPSAGDYRMFLDFQHAGTVRTVAFTVAAARGARRGATGPSHRQ